MTATNRGDKLYASHRGLSKVISIPKFRASLVIGAPVSFENSSLLVIVAFGDSYGYYPRMDTFKDKIILVTGAASGFGKALGCELGARGASILASDIDEERLGTVVQTINDAGGRASALPLDVTDAEAVRAAIDTTVAEQGRIDYLFNSAGIFLQREARDTTFEYWDRLVKINLMGVIHVVDAVYRHMIEKGDGHIVNMASVAGLVGFPTAAAYCATKHAVVGYSMTLRAEALTLGVKVTVVCPGPIATGIGSRALAPRTDTDIDPTGKAAGEILDRATLTILKGVERNKGIIIFPSKARRQWWLWRLFPSLFVRATQRRIKIYRRNRRNPSP